MLERSAAAAAAAAGPRTRSYRGRMRSRVASTRSVHGPPAHTRRRGQRVPGWRPRPLLRPPQPLPKGSLVAVAVPVPVVTARVMWRVGCRWHRRLVTAVAAVPAVPAVGTAVEGMVDVGRQWRR